MGNALFEETSGSFCRNRLGRKAPSFVDPLTYCLQIHAARLFDSRLQFPSDECDEVIVDRAAILIERAMQVPIPAGPLRRWGSKSRNPTPTISTGRE